jgi:hypothetical protein
VKVILLKDPLWELVKAKLQQEYDCADSAVAWARAWEIRYNLRHFNMARLRKRRLEAARMLREILHQ